MSLRAKAACNEAIHLYNAEKYDEAFYIFKSIADEEPNACYYLYLQYKLGRGVEPDFDEAIKWLVRSVDGDDSDISSNIIMIAEECSRAGEYERVLAVGEKLISRQDMRGYYILAREYISGNKEVRDYNKGLEYLKIGAANQNGQCLLMYGIILYNGKLIDQNKAEGVGFIVKAYEAAMNNKVYYKAEGNMVVLKDSNLIVCTLARGIIELDFRNYLAEGFIEKLIRKDLVSEAALDSEAAYLLGEAILYGICYDKRPKEALNWFRKSYEKGYKAAFEKYKEAFLTVLKTCSTEEFPLDELRTTSKWLVDQYDDDNEAFDFSSVLLQKDGFTKRTGPSSYSVYTDYLLEKNNINEIHSRAAFYFGQENYAKALEYYNWGYKLGDILCKYYTGLLCLISNSPDSIQMGINILTEIIAMDEASIKNYSVPARGKCELINQVGDSYYEYPLHLKYAAMNNILNYFISIYENNKEKEYVIIEQLKKMLEYCIYLYSLYPDKNCNVSYRRTISSNIFYIYQSIANRTGNNDYRNEAIKWGRYFLIEHDRLASIEGYSDNISKNKEFDIEERRNRYTVGMILGDYYSDLDNRFNPSRAELYYLASAEEMHLVFSDKNECEYRKAELYADLGNLFNEESMGDVGYYKAFRYYLKAIELALKIFGEKNVSDQMKKNISELLYDIPHRAGIIAARGLGIPADKDKAIELFRISSSQGNTNSDVYFK